MIVNNRLICQERYISVDIETAGPSPRHYSMLSIGAVTVFEPIKSIYIELQPINEAYTSEALKVSGLSLDKLRARGLAPKEAMTQFAEWINEVTTPDQEAVFVAFNAPFDWMFVNDYFHNYLGKNPFGHKALDVKAFYMGLTGACWHETSMKAITKRYFGTRDLTHHALRDAIDQAEIFRLMLIEAKERVDEETTEIK